jgi:hypothetical protein
VCVCGSFKSNPALCCGGEVCSLSRTHSDETLVEVDLCCCCFSTHSLFDYMREHEQNVQLISTVVLRTELTTESLCLFYSKVHK